jgi:hypothetical protein
MLKKMLIKCRFNDHKILSATTPIIVLHIKHTQGSRTIGNLLQNISTMRFYNPCVKYKIDGST